MAVASFLIEKGADVNATTSMGTTVFMYAKTAVQDDPTQTEILELLLQNGADINAKCTVRGWTVLDYVIRNEAHELQLWLTKKGAKKGSELN